jgi:hypothetical protein
MEVRLVTDLDKIADSCNQILLKLIELYEGSEINDTVFNNNTYVKINFLKDNIDNITDKNTKYSSTKLLDYFANKNKGLINVSSCNTQE